MSEPKAASRWYEILNDEDLAFLKRFVLASGSLKALSAAYGVSYPTVRLRLDRLINKIAILEELTVASEFERQARVLCADGRFDADTLRALLAAHRAEKETKHEPDGDRA